MSPVALKELCQVWENNRDDVIGMSSELSWLGPIDYIFNKKHVLQTGMEFQSGHEPGRAGLMKDAIKFGIMVLWEM